jgi:site-specific recombinase XerD
MLPEVTISCIWHRANRQWGIAFAYNGPFIRRLRQHLAVHWSATKRCFYTPYLPETLATLKQIFSNIATLTVIDQADEVQKPLAATATAVPKRIQPCNQPAFEQLVKRLELKGYSANTIKTYAGEFAQYLATLGQHKAADFAADRVKDYIHYCLRVEKLSENTVHSRLNALKFYYEQVLGREKFFVDIPRPKKPDLLPKVISEQKILAGILTVNNLKHRTLLLMAYSCGLRVSEVVSITVNQIDRDRMQLFIHQSKGKKDRVVPLAHSLLPFLDAYAAAYRPVHWLFENQTHNGPYSASSAQVVFRKAAAAIGLPPELSFHSLRHSYATHMLENGIDISLIKNLLGHNDLRTTMRYLHVSNRHIQAIENPLDALLRKHKKPPT